MNVYTDISGLVGRTPLLRLQALEQQLNLHAKLLVKLEGKNPGGSVKDRVAKHMIDQAEARGILKPGSVIVEPTSGNTGIGLAAIGAARGYRVILTMPDTMSRERQQLLRAYGAELILTPGKLGMQGAVERANALCAEILGVWQAGQFDNPDNPEAHYRTTGPEIWEDTDGEIDIFVAGVGTGGTLSGCSRYLKERKAIHTVAVEPAASPLLSKGTAGPHGLQGIGANFIPQTLDRSAIDEIIPVTEAQAYETGRMLARKAGLLVGITGGAAVAAAIQVAQRAETNGKTIVAILPDTGDKYLSTPMYQEESHV